MYADDQPMKPTYCKPSHRGRQANKKEGIYVPLICFHIKGQPISLRGHIRYLWCNPKQQNVFQEAHSNSSSKSAESVMYALEDDAPKAGLTRHLIPDGRGWVKWTLPKILLTYDSGCTHRSRLFSVLPPSHGQIRDISGHRHCSTHVVPMLEIGRNGRPMTAVDIQINSVDLCFPTFAMTWPKG